MDYWKGVCGMWLWVCVVCVAIRYKRCKMMFNLNDCFLILVWGFYCLVSIWSRYWVYFEWKRYDLRGFGNYMFLILYLMGSIIFLNNVVDWDFLNGMEEEVVGFVRVFFRELCFVFFLVGNFCCGLRELWVFFIELLLRWIFLGSFVVRLLRFRRWFLVCGISKVFFESFIG